MTNEQTSAREICEHMLAVTGAALKTGDFHLFAECFTFPQELQTFIGKRILHTEDDLQNLFREVRSFYLKNGVTDLSRRCVEAEFKDDHTIHTVYETRLISGTTIVKEAFPVFSWLILTKDSWKIAGTSYALPSSNEIDDAFLQRITPKENREEVLQNAEPPAKKLSEGL